MDADFALNERLSADTVPVAELELSTLRLMDDRRFAWVLLVPRRANFSELTDLTPAERSILVEEVAAVSSALKALTGAPRVNVGALGNIVAQLHVHVVARVPGDAAWPGPVWGAGTREPYGAGEAGRLAERLAAAVGRR